ncbi:uncharacterized protein LOC122501400 [Leptopilina heterotoma]|uniref:uncharacterized protein LOC122501400 n=1 Tax=Leptopilina heterotoma TaxID=63436 RepID=UPI001CA96B2E|nr:uncharacterized protein LOC122501400 [Leptopilina heterotoma]
MIVKAPHVVFTLFFGCFFYKNRPSPTTMTFKNPIKKCEYCGYKSTRAFNVFRHKKRIHGKAKKKIICCGRIYRTKGDYYCHVEEIHPHTRNGSISKKKYKITKKMLLKKTKRTSKKIKKNAEEILFLFDKNISWPTGKEIADYLRNIKFHKLNN